jgi:glycosyltransferase involved in cell wall biosynthesis
MRTAVTVEPYFSTGASEAPSVKHLLLISYYFPPINLVGATRWQKLARYAAERGWSLDVILVDPADAPGDEDRTRLLDLPLGVNLYTVPDRPSPHYELQRRLWRVVRPIFRRGESRQTAGEANGTPPEMVDGRRIGPAYLARLHYGELRRWARAAARLGCQLAAKRQPDVVVSSGPPQSTHMAGRLVAESTGAPWIMDMRDPWYSIDLAPKDMVSKTWGRLAARHEEECIRTARLVSVTTEALRRELDHRYPDAASRFLTVMNGADPQPVPAVPRSDRFTIAYAGNLYVGRDPRNLLSAVARVTQAMSLTPNDLSVEFMGAAEFARKPVLQIASEVGAEPFVKVIPPQPHRAALEFLASASMLVSLPQYAHMAIPAKVFEYSQFDAWLLILAKRGSATELLFRDTIADVVEPDDVDAIADAIRRRIEQHRRGERARAINFDGRFDRRIQAAALLDRIEQLV